MTCCSRGVTSRALKRKAESGRDEIAAYAKGENGHVYMVSRIEAMSSNLYNVSLYFNYT